ncbi:hypothetical protein Z043_123015 [Scleropages formosus]|uniref:Laminin EGF-like domain-containing protein n=1 Tax=Scleropages formosus TaxID=113540 RepID=A0A0P7UIW2_SCLFO|nr:hypothetical protein Z043_123015 [Scleropages formosus]
MLLSNQGCQHNTTGDHCHLCAPGYYGKVEGSIRDCSLCECPRGNKNSFSPTCVPEGSNDFRCDACQAGYEGQYCERCSAGYYGNPTEPDGRCEPCRCSPSGSSNPRCDSLTGRCECKPGVTGHRCEECEERHVPQGGQCVSLDEASSSLNETLDDELGESNSSQLMAEVEAMLDIMRKVELGKRNITVSNELMLAMEILQQVLNQLHGPKQVTNKLAKTMNATLWERHHQLQETRDLLSTAQARNNHTFSLLDTASANLDNLLNVKKNVSRASQFAETELEEAQKKLDITLSMVDNMVNGKLLLEQSRDELDLWNPTLRKQVDSLVMQMKKRQALELVYRAEDHAQVLIEKAQVLHSNLSGVRNISVNATSAVLANSNIQSSVEESWNLAKSANQTAASAFNLSQSSGIILRDVAAQAVQRSTAILSESRALDKEMADVFSPLFGERSRWCYALLPGTSDEIREVKEHAAVANDSLFSTLRRLEDFRQVLEESSLAVARANDSVRNTNELVTDSERTGEEKFCAAGGYLLEHH